MKRYRREEVEEQESDIEKELEDYVPYVSVKDRKKKMLIKHSVITDQEKHQKDDADKNEEELELEKEQEKKALQAMSLLDQHHVLKDQDDDEIKETETEKQLREEQKILESVAERKALMAATELAKGITYTDALKTSWNPPRYITAYSEERHQKVRKKYGILAEGNFIYLLYYIDFFCNVLVMFNFLCLHTYFPNRAS